MRTQLLTALAVSLAAAVAAPAPSHAAEVTRSVYQNAGAACHGEDNISEAMLERTPQRLRNKSDSLTATIICNLPTDLNAYYESGNYGQVTYVVLWAKRFVDLGNLNDTLSCTLTTSFADDPGTQTETHSNNPTTNPLPFAGTNNQLALTWDPVDAYGSGNAYYTPVNLMCALPPKAELNDFYAAWRVTVPDGVPVFRRQHRGR